MSLVYHAVRSHDVLRNSLERLRASESAAEPPVAGHVRDVGSDPSRPPISSMLPPFVDEGGDQGGPAGLVRGAQAGALVAVEVLVE